MDCRLDIFKILANGLPNSKPGRLRTVRGNFAPVDCGDPAPL